MEVLVTCPFPACWGSVSDSLTPLLLIFKMLDDPGLSEVRVSSCRVRDRVWRILSWLCLAPEPREDYF